MDNQARLNPVKIVCAANRFNQTIFCSARHGSPAMHTQLKKACVSYFDTEEGFIDQYDRWWSRTEAYKIMKATGQPILDRCFSNTELFSENLY